MSHESAAECPYGAGGYHGGACDRCQDFDHCVDTDELCMCGCHDGQEGYEDREAGQ